MAERVFKIGIVRNPIEDMPSRFDAIVADKHASEYRERAILTPALHHIFSGDVRAITVYIGGRGLDGTSKVVVGEGEHEQTFHFQAHPKEEESTFGAGWQLLDVKEDDSGPKVFHALADKLVAYRYLHSRNLSQFNEEIIKYAEKEGFK